MGYLAAESANALASRMKQTPDGREVEPVAEFCGEIIARREGDPWEDAQATIQNTMTYYNLEIKSETMANRGLENLSYLKNTMRLVAANPHEMTHCLEARNLIECAEMILRATIERKETRFPQLIRVDYPEKDDANFFCFIGQRQEGGKVIFEKHTPQR
jgi:succinate dehydrogenase/fumarate reductase flavoprotein subunit